MKYLDVFLVTIFSGLMAYWGRLDEAVRILLIVSAIDVLTGAIRAIVEKKLSATRAWRGASKKAIMFLLVIATNVLGSLIVTEPLAGPLSVAVCTFYIYGESISIIDNAAAVGVPIPAFLRDALYRVTIPAAPTPVPPPRLES